MSQLLERDPYGPRDNQAFLDEMNALTGHHRAGCSAFAKVWPEGPAAASVPELPFLHVGVFKHVDFRTRAPGVTHQRTLLSSATTNGQPSRIVLDQESSELQARSTARIHENFVGCARRPLLILDDARSLRRPAEVSARIAAAMSLRPLASQMRFILDGEPPGGAVAWDQVSEVASQHDELFVYGFTWVLWTKWAVADLPVRDALRGKQVCFVHSGGWKKLGVLAVQPADFNARLLDGLDPGSRVIDFYGLVEQAGVVYPMCEHGSRHVPVWADVLVRDGHTLQPQPAGHVGMLQLLNVLARGAPYHSVLTEDLGRLLDGDCPCGRKGRRFELLGRVPKAQVRGCANV